VTRSPRSRTTPIELKIPAQAEFVIVVKRVASALASGAGFTLEGVDDLNIAVAQACEKAIAAGDHIWGPGNGILKLTFHVDAGGVEVEVRTAPAKEATSVEVSADRTAKLARQAEGYRRTAAKLSAEVAAERGERIRAQREALRLAELSRTAPTQPPTAVDLDDVAVNMIRLFVDELRYNVDSRGGMRMRMVKYHVE
jgi:hypothetical protein